MSFPASIRPRAVTRALCVAAHPDDIDFGAGGTVARWVDEGVEVAYLLVTRGDSGGFDDTPRELMPALREAEQRAAAEIIGVKQVDFLDGYTDGMVEPTVALRRDITRAIRAFRPERVLTTSPLRNWARIAGPGHPDHVAVGEATVSAIYPDARNPFAYPELLRDEGLEPWHVQEVWFHGGPAPDHVVDVTATYRRKLEGLRAHASQTAHMDLDARLRERLGDTARRGGLQGGSLAEAFTVLPTD